MGHNQGSLPAWDFLLSLRPWIVQSPVLVINVSGASNKGYVLYRKICDMYAHDHLKPTATTSVFSLTLSPLPCRDNRNKKSVQAGDSLTWWRVSGVWSGLSLCTCCQYGFLAQSPEYSAVQCSVVHSVLWTLVRVMLTVLTCKHQPTSHLLP